MEGYSTVSERDVIQGPSGRQPNVPLGLCSIRCATLARRGRGPIHFGSGFFSLSSTRPLAQLRNVKLLPAVVMTQEVVMIRALKEQLKVKGNRVWRLARLAQADRSSKSGI